MHRSEKIYPTIYQIQPMHFSVIALQAKQRHENMGHYIVPSCLTS